MHSGHRSCFLCSVDPPLSVGLCINGNDAIYDVMSSGCSVRCVYRPVRASVWSLVPAKTDGARCQRGPSGLRRGSRVELDRCKDDHSLSPAAYGRADWSHGGRGWRGSDPSGKSRPLRDRFVAGRSGALSARGQSGAETLPHASTKVVIDTK